MILFTLLVTGVKSYRIYITFEDQTKAYKSRQVSLDQPFNWSGIWREGQIKWSKQSTGDGVKDKS